MAFVEKDDALQLARFGWLAAQSSNAHIVEMVNEDLDGFVDEDTKKALLDEFLREV